MKKIQIANIVILYLFLFISCVSQEQNTVENLSRNSLILSDPNSLYPNESYLIASGTGESREDAENQAIASLAQIFESEIIVDTQSRQSYRSAFDDLEHSGLESEITQNININAEHNLINVRYSDIYQDNNENFHIIAYLDRYETGGIYRDLIQTNNDRVNMAILSADEVTGLVQKYILVQEALTISQANEILIAQLRIINSSIERIVRPDIRFVDIEAINRNLLSQMVFSVSIEGDTGGISNHLAEELSDLGFATSNDGALGITGSLVFQEGGSSEEYETILWMLNLSFVDSDGVLIYTVDETNRERALDLVTAEFLAVDTIKKIISESISGDLLSDL